MVEKFEEDIERLLRCKLLVRIVARFFRFPEAAEFSDRLLHG